MTKSKLFDWAESQYGTLPDYPWNDDNAVLRHRSGKWYGLVMNIPKSKLGLKDDGNVDVLNVKCDPVIMGSLRACEGIHPAYHMNKDKWITVRLDGSVNEEEVQNLLSLSYELTKPKVKRIKHE